MDVPSKLNKTSYLGAPLCKLLDLFIFVSNYRHVRSVVNLAACSQLVQLLKTLSQQGQTDSSALIMFDILGNTKQRLINNLQFNSTFLTENLLPHLAFRAPKRICNCYGMSLNAPPLTDWPSVFSASESYRCVWVPVFFLSYSVFNTRSIKPGVRYPMITLLRRSLWCPVDIWDKERMRLGYRH